MHGVAPPSEAEAVSFLKQMLGAHAGDAGHQGTLSQEDASPFASSAAASSFDAPRSLMGNLPPAVQLAVQHEFAARFGAAPTDGGEVMALFGKSLLDEYASNSRSFQSLSEAVSPASSPGEQHEAAGFHPSAQLHRGSSNGTLYSADATPLGSTRRTSSAGRFSAAARAVRISGCRPTMSSLPTGLTMAGFQTANSASYKSFTAEHVTVLSDLQERDLSRLAQRDESPASALRMELGESTRDAEVDAHARESTFGASPVMFRSFKKRSMGKRSMKEVRIGSFFGGGSSNGSSRSGTLSASTPGATAAGVAASKVASSAEGAEGGSVVEFALTLDGAASDFDEASVKARLVAQMGGAAAGVTAADISFAVSNQPTAPSPPPSPPPSSPRSSTPPSPPPSPPSMTLPPLPPLMSSLPSLPALPPLTPPPPVLAPPSAETPLLPTSSGRLTSLGRLTMTVTIRMHAPAADADAAEGGTGARTSPATKRWQRYARVSRTMDKLLSSPASCATAFGLPLRTVDAQPRIFRPAPLTYKLEGAQLQQAIDLALGGAKSGGVKSSAARDSAMQSGLTSDDLEMLSAEDGARARRLGCVCAAMAVLLLALALVATFGGGDAAPDATTAVPVAVGGAGVIALLAAAKWLSGRHARRHTKTVAARVERKLGTLLAEDEGTTAPRPVGTPTDMFKSALRPQRANQVADSNRSSRSYSPASSQASGSPTGRRSMGGAPSPAGFRTDGRVAPVISPVTSPRPDASAALSNPTSPMASPANPPHPAHLLDRDRGLSRGAGGLAPDARLQARSSVVRE